jgi:CDP-paratose 2-epimerase
MNPLLITGGAGFIGTNIADRFMSLGQPVIVLDNLSRPGVEHNLRWLSKTHGPRLRAEIGDVRDASLLRRLVPKACAVIHLAAQTAVTTSLKEPEPDFEVNARGTVTLLEALRGLNAPPPLIFTSTNKVYGSLSDVALDGTGPRYEPVDPELRRHGISECRALEFHTPYGCSKGTADQYVLEYARSFGLPTALFRMSCIYGPHQCGTEDQGWVAHFVIRAIEESPICVYGDGRQVRDLLYVEDLVDAFQLALKHIDHIAGEAFNIGGGVANTASVLEVLEQIRSLHRECQFSFDAWRPSDQRYYVSNTRKFQAATGWAPRVNVKQGIERLYSWMLRERSTRGSAAQRKAAVSESARKQAS